MKVGRGVGARDRTEWALVRRGSSKGCVGRPGRGGFAGSGLLVVVAMQRQQLPALWWRWVYSSQPVMVEGGEQQGTPWITILE